MSERYAVAFSPLSSVPRHTESTFDQFPIGVVGVDRRGVILSWNRRAGNILGRENSEVINAAFAGLFPDYERPSLMAFVERSCRRLPGRRLRRPGSQRYRHRHG